MVSRRGWGGLMLLAAAIAVVCGTAFGQAIPVVNPSFEQGQDKPDGWSLSGGEGAWIENGFEGQRAVAVTGSGEGTNHWLSDPLPLEPSTAYCLQFSARDAGAERSTGGTPITGPVFCNRDLGMIAAEWTRYTSIFATPAQIAPDLARLRLGQWCVKGTIAFDDVALVRAQPIYVRSGDLVLGEGESLHGSTYEFKAPYYGESANQSRPLVSYNCTFNTYRWVLSPDAEVIYSHALEGRRQTKATVEIQICHYEGGELVVQASRDGKSWREIGALHEKGSRSWDVPGDLLPAPEIRVRLGARAQGTDAAFPPGAFQIDAYRYTATVDGPAADVTGGTRFIRVVASDPRLKVSLDTFGDGAPGGDNVLVARVTNLADQPIPAKPTLTLDPGNTPATYSVETALATGEQTVRVPYNLVNAGQYAATFSLGLGIDYKAETALRVAHLHDASYGQRLPGTTEAVGIWWAGSGWKVSPTRPMPDANSDAIEIRLAANETEAAQLVVRPSAPLNKLTAMSADLTSPNGATLPGACIEVLRVRYVPVTQPTDAIGVAGPWPDPLPPFQGPIDVAAGRNQPLWVRVHTPKGTPAGTYAGVIRLDAEDYHCDVPLRVVVHGFALPDRMTCTSAFGFSPGRVFQYHNVTDPAQQRIVLAKYLESFSAHHISPYDPAPLDPFKVTWPKATEWQGGIRDRKEKHSGESSLLLDDQDAKTNVECHYNLPLTIPPGGFKLRFAYKTREPGRPVLVTFQHYDANDQWMQGRNNDMRIEGNGQWQIFEGTVTEFPEGAKTARVILRPALWAEDGSTTGAAWFDEVTIQDAGARGQLVIGGGFEPLGPDVLKPSFDWSAWDVAMGQAMSKYHFNTFSVPIQGMGGGTFFSRTEPTLLGYKDDTPEYQAAFGAYCRIVQEHLRQQGWVKDAFVYWFDEPEPRDYAFVMNGFRKLTEAAPDITRMLTEQVEPALAGGPNIWCPLTPEYKQEAADVRRAAGDRFWWYICCGPKEPYCGLFIDHPATEFRVWLWQTWQRRINGILIWETSWWTSATAYPDPAHPQNPYEDPMGWTDGYGIPIGSRIPWGNGDGRFIYPPEAAADAHPAQPVLEGPVDSIRWEMLRDGIEDYEYMVILNRLIEQQSAKLTPEKRAGYAALLDVPPSISTSLTVFTKDPKPIEQHREAVARAIEELTALQ